MASNLNNPLPLSLSPLAKSSSMTRKNSIRRIRQVSKSRRRHGRETKEVVKQVEKNQLSESIHMLPDGVLLVIFDFDVDDDYEEYGSSRKRRVERWITLAHVCQRWRSVVFQSPHRLNLRLVCTHHSKDIDIWPPLPLVIHDYDRTRSSVDNIIAALEHNTRVCQIKLYSLTSSELEKITDSAAMQKPFPELTHLQLGVSKAPGPNPPDSILGGTPHAPRLRLLSFSSFPFPGVPKLLLSLTHLVHLALDEIPPSGYFPPEAMATSLSALTSLESLHLRFEQPRPRPAIESRHPLPPPLTRSVLPTLTRINFKGASEYLEVILARIDTTRLNALDIRFFNQMIFDTPQFFQLINRTSTLRAPQECRIIFLYNEIYVRLPLQTSYFLVNIRCRAPEWQVSSVEQLCTKCLPPVSTLQDFYIFKDQMDLRHGQDDVESSLWLDLLRSFVAVKNIYLTEECARVIAPALQELVGGRITEVLPTLENIFIRVERSIKIPEGIEKFVAARQLINRPVILSYWDR